jgi:hypothetical protein
MRERTPHLRLDMLLQRIQNAVIGIKYPVIEPISPVHKLMSPDYGP